MIAGVLFVSKLAVESRYITREGMCMVSKGEAEFTTFSDPKQFEEYVEAHLLMFEWWELVESPA